MTKSRIVMGIDPGFADMGYGIIEVSGNDARALEYGSIKTSSKQEFPKRLEELFNKIGAIIDKYAPSVIGVEEIYFSKNIKTGITVAHARGVLLLAASIRGIQIYECSPQNVKMAVTGYGSAEKTQVQKMVKTILKLAEIPHPDDAADALAIALWASQQRLL
jgi:crossover junction endodeoxyribonuclease RuvC